MSVKVHPEYELNVNKEKRKVYVIRKRKRKKKRKKKIEKKPSLFEVLQEKYRKRKWLVRTVFITKCTVSIILIILEFVL